LLAILKGFIRAQPAAAAGFTVHWTLSLKRFNLTAILTSVEHASHFSCCVEDLNIEPKVG
jgi:hypothetical protein